MTILIIARHGNTFEKDETPRRVGLRTDLPLTAAGIEQGKRIGVYLKNENLLPDVVFVSDLRRTQDTARAALVAVGLALKLERDARFNEIDYGPDENKIEDDVTARIGADALRRWDADGVMPPGWSPDPAAIIAGWQSFAARMVRDYPSGRVLVVTSNGIARFAPHLTGDFDSFREGHNLKIATGALAVLRHDGAAWSVAGWNIKP